MPDFAVKTAFTAVDNMSPAFARINKSVASVETSFSRIKTIAAGFTIGSFIERGIMGIGNLITETIDSAVAFERLKTSFKSVFQGTAEKEMQFVREEAKRLGLEFNSTAGAYKSISAAAKGSAITQDQVKNVFIGVSEGAAALQLTSEQSEGALTALSQMISKGKVQAEELRGQLGERLPGAFQIAARAMGMTTAQLDKFMSDGKLTADIFIPKFAAQMHKEFGPAALEASNSFAASANRFKNLTGEMKVNVGNVILPMLSDLMSAFAPIVVVIGEFFKENKEGISSLIKLLPWLLGAYVAWKFAILGIAAIMKVQAAVEMFKYIKMMNGFRWVVYKATIQQWLLNAAFLANPITWIVLGIMALIAAGVALYTKWDSIKQFFIDFWNKWQGLIKLALLPLWPFIEAGKFLIDAWQPVKDFFVALWGYIIQGVDMIMPYINKIAEFASWIGDKISSGLQAAEQGARILTAPNSTEAEGKYGNNTNVNVYSNGTEAKADVTPKSGASVNMKMAGANI